MGNLGTEYYQTIATRYNSAARKIISYLSEFVECSDVPYDELIETTAKNAAGEIARLRAELAKVKSQRDELAVKTDGVCDLCANNLKCQGRECEKFCEGDAPAGVDQCGRPYSAFHWTCEDFNFGTCPKLENTPCNGCYDDNYRGFRWKED